MARSSTDLSAALSKVPQVTLAFWIIKILATTLGETIGAGVVELAAKYKLLHQRKGSWTPDVAVFPRLFLPTADARFASTRLNMLLPFWAQKDFGPWSVFGGGGY